MATKQEILDAISGAEDDEEIVFLDQDENKTYDLVDSGSKDYKWIIYIEPKR